VLVLNVEHLLLVATVVHAKTSMKVVIAIIAILSIIVILTTIAVHITAHVTVIIAIHLTIAIMGIPAIVGAVVAVTQYLFANVAEKILAFAKFVDAVTKKNVYANVLSSHLIVIHIHLTEQPANIN
jgi:hypothetical protein